MHVGVLVIAPRDDAAVRTQTRGDLEHGLGPRRRPCELLLARPLQQHRAARALRQDRRLERGVGVAVAAICAARYLGKDTDFFLGQADCLRDLLAYAERAVRADV